MPPKKDENKTNTADSVAGFEPRETKLLAAAFLSSVGPDKYDYEVMATLTGNTSGSLKKMFPPVKRKAIEAHPSFAAFLGAQTATDGTNGEEKKAAFKAAARKRKATPEPETDAAAKDLQPEGEKADGKKKAPAKGRGRPKKAKSEKDDVKKETTLEDDDQAKDAEDDAEDDI